MLQPLVDWTVKVATGQLTGAKTEVFASGCAQHA
jgi:hypothetical protein